jgi:DNA-binding HxlR family transcriptional regulator
MRSYRQYCSVAKALELIGDRWNMLIVRELLYREPCRYTDLLRGLPGIATNLLADRLRDLEEAGVLTREDAPPPVATTLFRLTERGRQLDRIILELGRWGYDLLPETAGDEAFRSRWLAMPVALFLTDDGSGRPPVTIQVLTGDEPMIIETVEGAVRTRAGSVERPDLVLSGTPEIIGRVIAGTMSLADAQADGLDYDGDPDILGRLQRERPPRPLARA